MRTNWSIEFKDHSCWCLKVFSRTKKLGFDGTKQTQSIYNLRTICLNWKVVVSWNEVKLKHWVQRSFLLVFDGLKKSKEVGFWWNFTNRKHYNLRTIYSNGMAIVRRNGTNWSNEFKDHSCWVLKVFSRTKKLGFDGT